MTSQSPWSPDIGMTAYDDGFGGADIGLYAWNLEAGEEYILDWELANEDGIPIEGDSMIIVAAGPVSCLSLYRSSLTSTFGVNLQ